MYREFVTFGAVHLSHKQGRMIGFRRFCVVRTGAYGGKRVLDLSVRTQNKFIIMTSTLVYL
jgi:hypothetical protein